MSKRDRTRPAPQARTRSAGSESRARSSNALDHVEFSVVPTYEPYLGDAPRYGYTSPLPSPPAKRKAIPGKALKPFQPSRLAAGYLDPNRVQKTPPRPDLTPCRAIAVRREVLFATNSTGKGSHAPKVKFTNRRCK